MNCQKPTISTIVGFPHLNDQKKERPLWKRT